MEVIAKVIPVILLFALGVVFNRTQFLRPNTMQDFKKLILNITLPAALFLSFSRVKLQSSYFLIILVIFAACGLGLLAGRELKKWLNMPSAYFPLLMTGFEAGMMGYAIFGAVYGTANIYKFGIVDIGQALFVYLVSVPLLERMNNGEQKTFKETIEGVAKTPVILAILIGILASQTGFADWMRAQPLADSILKTMDMLGQMTTPIIALVIGYEMRLEGKNLARPMQTILVRYMMWIVAGILINVFIIRGLLHLDETFQAAVMTMMVLPPPFVIPLFMTTVRENDREFVVNTLSLATLVTLVAFSVVSFIYHP